MREYDEETLHHLQRVERMIFKDFIDTCEKYNLRYFGIGGTGIGALRHKGFIPWDDDIDVALPAEDFHKLLEIYDREWSDKYNIINTERDINYPFPTTRIMLNGTQFCEEALATLPLDLGIFLDVYCFDNVSDDEREYKKQVNDTWFWSHMRILVDVPHPVILADGIKGKLLRAGVVVGRGICKLFRVSTRKMYAREQEARNRYAHVKTKRIAYMNDTYKWKETYFFDDIFPVRKLEYEGMMVAFPRDLEYQLELLYGDYMQLPPVEKRKNHYPARLDFGPY